MTPTSDPTCATECVSSNSAPDPTPGPRTRAPAISAKTGPRGTGGDRAPRGIQDVGDHATNSPVDLFGEFLRQLDRLAFRLLQRRSLADRKRSPKRRRRALLEVCFEPPVHRLPLRQLLGL